MLRLVVCAFLACITNCLCLPSQIVAMGNNEARRLARKRDRAEATAKRRAQIILKRQLQVTGEVYSDVPPRRRHNASSLHWRSSTGRAYRMTERVESFYIPWLLFAPWMSTEQRYLYACSLFSVWISWLLFAPWMKPFACSVLYISIVRAAVVTRVDVLSHFLTKLALRFDQLFAVKVAVVVVFVEVSAVVVRSRISSSF